MLVAGMWFYNEENKGGGIMFIEKGNYKSFHTFKVGRFYWCHRARRPGTKYFKHWWRIAIKRKGEA